MASSRPPAGGQDHVTLSYAQHERRSPIAFRGFAAERIVIEAREPYDFSWTGTDDYVALHDIALSDGETRIEGDVASRLCDLTDRMTYIPAQCAISGWSAPRRRANSFTALYIRPNEIAAEVREHFVGPDRRPLVYFEDPALLSTLRKIDQLLQVDALPDPLYAETLGLLAIMEIQRMEKARPRPGGPIKGGLSQRQQQLLRDHIEDSLAAELTLGELAALAGLTRFHFARAFATSFGEPPHQYVQRRRVARAKTLLRTTNADMTAVARTVGFGSATLLGRHVRRLLGVSPRELRRGADPDHDPHETV